MLVVCVAVGLAQEARGPQITATIAHTNSAPANHLRFLPKNSSTNNVTMTRQISNAAAVRS
jgi:hypothetical protein